MQHTSSFALKGTQMFTIHIGSMSNIQLQKQAPWALNYTDKEDVISEMLSEDDMVSTHSGVALSTDSSSHIPLIGEYSVHCLLLKCENSLHLIFTLSSGQSVDVTTMGTSPPPSPPCISE